MPSQREPVGLPSQRELVRMLSQREPVRMPSQREPAVSMQVALPGPESESGRCYGHQVQQRPTHRGQYVQAMDMAMDIQMERHLAFLWALLMAGQMGKYLEHLLELQMECQMVKHWVPMWEHQMADQWMGKMVMVSLFVTQDVHTLPLNPGYRAINSLPLQAVSQGPHLLETTAQFTTDTSNSYQAMPGPYQGKFVEAMKKIEELNQQFRPSKSEASMYWDENVKKALVENGIKLSTFGPCMVYSQGMVGLCYAEDADAYMVQIKQALKMVEMKDSSKKAVMLISTSTSGKSFNASGSMPLWLECYGTYLRTQDKMSSSQFISVHNASTNPSTGMKRWPRAPTAISLEPKAFEPDKDTRVDWQLALAKGLPGETFQYIQKILRGW